MSPMHMKGQRHSHHSLFTLQLVQAVVSFMPWLLYAGEQALNPIKKEAAWALELVWTF